MTLDIKKTADVLEFGKVLQILSGFAVSEMAKQLCLDAPFHTRPQEVVKAQEQTGAALEMLLKKGSPPFMSLKDVDASLKRANLGGALSMGELLSVAKVLQSAKQLKRYAVSKTEEATPLDGFFRQLHTNPLEEEITTSIISEESMADNASPELYNIRRKIRTVNSQVRDTLQKIIASPTHQKHLQETIITERNGRHVVPVKAEFKNEIKGLVHDMSASGATYFIEPMQVVTLNNQLRELSSAQEDEVYRILASLSAKVSEISDQIEQSGKVICLLDFIFARAKYSLEINAVPPEINENGETNLIGARHPLLDKATIVPISINIGQTFDSLIITGPNTGGKTVSLKTLGIIAMMAQSGLHIPCKHGSTVNIYNGIYADIGDEQSIEQSLSTFSSHMTNIVRILEQDLKNTLVLLDELGAGTDPVEGAALAISIIEHLRQRKAKTAVTSHYAELKTYALTTPRVENAGCEFDVATLKPTYRLLIGIPGKSNAFAISKRLGLPEPIIHSATSLLDNEDRRFDQILAQLEEKQRQVEKQLAEISQMKEETQKFHKSAADNNQVIQKQLDDAAKYARDEAKKIIDGAKYFANNIFNEADKIKKAENKKLDNNTLNQAKAQVRAQLNQANQKLAEQAKTENVMHIPQREINIGDTVEVISAKVKGQVVALDKSKGATVLCGILKITARLDDLMYIEDTQKVQTSGVTLKTASSKANAKSEIDLRGMMVDEAIMCVDRFIDGAAMAKLENVTLIHGKGTGSLRAAIGKHLKTHKFVKSFRLGTFGEGESGVTVVELK